MPTEIQTIAKLIDTYGLSLVLLVAILLFLNRKVVPKLDQLWDLFIGKAVKEEEEDLRDKDKHLRELLEGDNETNLILRDAMIRNGSCRVAIWQFHNGVRSLGGIPFLRLSITHEQTDISPVMSLYQNIPLSLYSNVISALLTKNYLILQRDEPEYETMKLMMKDTGVCTKIFLPIKDYRGKLYGAISFAWLESRKLTLEEVEDLTEIVNRVSIVLETMDKNIKFEDRRNYGRRKDDKR